MEEITITKIDKLIINREATSLHDKKSFAKLQKQRKNITWILWVGELETVLVRVTCPKFTWYFYYPVHLDKRTLTILNNKG